MLIESAENLIEDNLLDPDNSAPDHSNETQFSRQILELRAENKNLTKVIEYNDESMQNIEPIFNRIIEDCNTKCETYKNKCQKYSEEIDNLDRAYKYTYNRFDELKRAYDLQKNNETKLVKTNADLRKALDLSAKRINELMCEIVETKSKYEEDISKFGSTLKLNAVKISGLECDIQAMSRQKEELTLICEDLLSQHAQ